MRKLLYLLVILTSTAYGQEVEHGTIFTIEFNNPKKNMEFNLISKKTSLGIIDNIKIDSIFINNKPKENQIIGVFTKTKLGSRIRSSLILVSGLNNNVGYNLEIKTLPNGEFEPTSTSPLLKGIRSSEYWPYHIEKINFSDFKFILLKNLEPIQFEEKIDSTCIKNADKNIAFGEQEFKSYFKSIVLKFKNDKRFNLETSLKYEKSINSKDASLGHFWSLGKGIYPNKKRYKFGTPFTFKKAECPYFEVSTNYFYTKGNRDVKVVSFEWDTFKESNLVSDSEVKKDSPQKFIEKYNFLVEAVSEVLGKPLAIEQEKNSGRRDTKWRSKNGIHAYLFKFDNYHEIRLFVYKN